MYTCIKSYIYKINIRNMIPSKKFEQFSTISFFYKNEKNKIYSYICICIRKDYIDITYKYKNLAILMLAMLEL